MTAFKLLMKVLKAKITSVVLYGLIFLIISTVNYFNSNSNEQFVLSKHRIILYDNDQSELSKEFCGYLADKCEIASLPESVMDSETSQRKLLYYTTIHDVVYINKGFGEKILDMKSEPEKLVTVKNVHNNDELLSLHTNNFINAVRGYLLAGKSGSEAVSLAAEALKNTADVKIESFEKSSGSNIGQYFGMLPYVAISMIMSALSPVLFAIYRRDIYFRTACSCINQTRFTMEVSLAGFTLVTVLWAIFMGVGLIFNGGMLIGRENLVFINSFVLYIMSACLSILVSVLRKNIRVVDFLNQIFGLGMCFLCGVFVPMQYLSPSVVSAAKFLPVYYYVRANSLIFDEAFSTHKFVVCIGVQLLFAAAFLACAIAAKRRKRVLEQ